VKNRQGTSRLKAAQEIAESAAEAHGFELVEVTLQNEDDGLALCVYIDKPGGITLDDCERFHKAVQPRFEEIEYDYMEISSPGADRPVKTQRDFEKRRGDAVEIRLFAKLDGAKQFIGALTAMNEDTVTIQTADGQEMSFPRKAVALIKPVITLLQDEE
jgi:ribosome maturation factor RimP